MTFLLKFSLGLLEGFESFLDNNYTFPFPTLFLVKHVCMYVCSLCVYVHVHAHVHVDTFGGRKEMHIPTQANCGQNLETV